MPLEKARFSIDRNYRKSGIKQQLEDALELYADKHKNTNLSGFNKFKMFGLADDKYAELDMILTATAQRLEASKNTNWTLLEPLGFVMAKQVTPCPWLFLYSTFCVLCVSLFLSALDFCVLAAMLRGLSFQSEKENCNNPFLAALIVAVSAES